jgi:hypothetical protein
MRPGGNIVTVKRFVSYVDAADQDRAQGVSAAVRFGAELDDGEFVVLLDDRGWASSGAWSQVSLAEVDETTRVVVGPDEPRDHETWEEAEAGHWGHLREILAEQGVDIGVADLRSVPHDVVPSTRLLERIAGKIRQ